MTAAEAFFAANVARGTVGHAFLLEGTDRELRRRAAEHILSLLLCETHEGCGICEACRALQGGNYPDVIWVRHEKPDTISVGEIRSQLVEDMGIRPYRGGLKIYLVDEAEKMNPQAQNALLKTLEEPPAYGMMFLLTENRSRMLPTVLSRLTVLSAEEAEEAGDLSADEGHSALAALVENLETLPVAELAGAAAALSAKGLEPKAAVSLLKTVLRDIGRTKAGAAGESFLDAGCLARCAELISDPEWSALWDFLEESRKRLAANGNPDLVLEVFFLRFRDAIRRGVNRVGEKDR